MSPQTLGGTYILGRTKDRPPPASGEDLRQLPLLASLTDDELAMLSDSLVAIPLRPRAVLNYAQSIGNSTAFVWTGCVRVEALTPTGVPFTLGTLLAGECFGVNYELMGAKPADIMRVTALGPSLLLTIPGELIHGRLKSNSAFREDLLRYCALQAAWALSRVYEFAAFNVRDRLLSALLRMSSARSDPPWTIMPAPTHAMLAAQIGATREAVSRQLKELEGEGIVKAESGALRITRPDRAYQLARTKSGNHLLNFPAEKDADGK